MEIAITLSYKCSKASKKCPNLESWSILIKGGGEIINNWNIFEHIIVIFGYKFPINLLYLTLK